MQVVLHMVQLSARLIAISRATRRRRSGEALPALGQEPHVTLFFLDDGPGRPAQADLAREIQSVGEQLLWDSDKNNQLHRERGVCFEDVLLSLDQGSLLDRLEQPNQEKYPGQQIMVVAIGEYA